MSTSASPEDLPRYGLDIETDTAVDGLDPATSAILSVAVVGPSGEHVFDGPETGILIALDRLLTELPAGVLVTWNGGGFDLPFLADRARRHGIELGLRMRVDPAVHKREPLPGHKGHYRATWYHHRHLDGYLVYRADVGASLHLSCALKAVARLVGIPAISVDASQVHRLSVTEMRAYVASDARVARELINRRWANAEAAIDRPDYVLWGPPPQPEPAPTAHSHPISQRPGGVTHFR